MAHCFIHYEILTHFQHKTLVTRIYCSLRLKQARIQGIAGYCKAALRADTRGANTGGRFGTIPFYGEAYLYQGDC